MKAVDTNVVLRWLIEDDPEQTRVARELFETPTSVTLTVLLETAWVLSSRYRFDRAHTAHLLRSVVEVRLLDVENIDAVNWALDRYASGGDLADMIHIVAAIRIGAFATFDRGVARAAGADPPVAIETLG